MFWDILQTLGLIATPIGIFLAWEQLKLNRKQEVTAFEDSLAREYRKLAASGPTTPNLRVIEDRFLTVAALITMRRPAIMDVSIH